MTSQDGAHDEVRDDVPGAGAGRIRASDAEREEIVTILRTAISEGRLTLQEGEERMAQAYATIYRDDLGGLTGDLPVAGRTGAGGRAAGMGRAGGGSRDSGRPNGPSWDDTSSNGPWGPRPPLRHGIGGPVLVAVGALVALLALTGAHVFWPAIPLLFLLFGCLRGMRWRMARQSRGGGWRGPHHGRGDGPWGHGAWGPGPSAGS